MDNGNSKLSKLHASAEKVREWLTPFLFNWIEDELSKLHGKGAWLPPTTYLWEPDMLGRIHRTVVGISWEKPTTPPVHSKTDEIGYTFRALPVLSQLLILQDLFQRPEFDMMVSDLYILPAPPTLRERRKIEWQMSKSMSYPNSTRTSKNMTPMSDFAWLDFGIRWKKRLRNWKDRS